MHATQSLDDRVASGTTTGPLVANSVAQARDDVTPTWKRIARAVGRAWMEGSVLSDPIWYSFYLSAKAEAEA